MTSKEVFTELVQRFGAGGNVRDDFPYTLGDIMPPLDFAYSSAVSKRMREIEARDRVRDIDSSITKKYKLTIVDGVATLPVSITRLPSDMGVYQVSYKSVQYHRTSPDYLDKFRGLMANRISAQPKFWVEDDKVKFYNLPDGIDCVDALLIPLPSSLEENEEILFPAGYEEMILDSVMQKMGFAVQVPEDYSNNGRR